MRDRVESFEVPLAVACGGAIGSLLRYGMAQAIVVPGFPLATLVTNVLGSFALGVVLVAGEVIGGRAGHHHRHQLRRVRLWRPFMATGVLGGFTTFSTLVLEVDRLAPATGAAYLLVSVVAGLAAYVAGNGLARRRWEVSA